MCVYIYVIFLKYLRFCYASITSLHSPIYIFICKYQNINMNIRMKINKYNQINYIYIILVCRTVCRPRSSYTHVCVCVQTLIKPFISICWMVCTFLAPNAPPREAASRHYPKKSHRRTPIYTFFYSQSNVNIYSTFGTEGWWEDMGHYLANLVGSRHHARVSRSTSYYPNVVQDLWRRTGRHMSPLKRNQIFASFCR